MTVPYGVMTEIGWKMFGAYRKWRYEILPTAVELHPNDTRAINIKDEMTLPTNTYALTLRGTYNVMPKGVFWVVVRRGNAHRPQGQMHFVSQRWDTVVYFDPQGKADVLIARVSPGVNLAFEHYRERVEHLKPIHERNAAIDLQVYMPLNITGSMDGFTPIAGFKVRFA